jgi:hypothetical protein
MHRAVFAGLALLAAVPAAAVAQSMPVAEPSLWGDRIRITPFVGQAGTVSRTEYWTVLVDDAGLSSRFDVDLGAGPAAGASVEIRAVQRFALLLAGTYVSRGRTTEFSLADGDFIQHNGSNFLMAKAAVAMRLREGVSEMQLRRLTATIFAGPAYIREMPKDDFAKDPVLLGGLNAWAVNFGFDAEVPMGNLLAFQFGIEDYYTWWNADEIARRNDIAFRNDGFNTVSFLEIDPSHMILFRIGLTVRVR